MRLHAPLRALLSVLLASLALAAGTAGAAERSPETQAEIDYLLDRVASSGYVFIRNGDEHDSAEAADHMRRKYEHFDDEIDTAETFIEKSATRSLLTRRAYEVRFPDGSQAETAEWLLGELAAYRDSRADRLTGPPAR